MAKRFLVQTDFDAKDNLSAPMRRMGRGFGRFATQITDRNSAIGRSFGRVNQGINRIAAVGLVALTAAVGVAANEYVAFDQTIVGANARFVDFVAGSEKSVQTLQLLKDAARATGAQTQFSATEAAAGLNFYAKAGFSSAEAMAVLADTVDLATVAEEDFNRTADISSDLLSSLGLNVADSSKKIENLKNLNRALGIAVNAANVSLDDMFETLKVVGPIGTQAGASMNELVAITSALGGAGIKGSMAATALKNSFIRLAAPTGIVIDALEKIGLSQKDFIDQNDDMKSMVDIMKILGDATSELGGAEQLGIFAEIFGKNAVAGATNMAKSLSEIEFIMAKLEANTALKDLADEIRRGLGMQLLILKSSLLELGFQFVQAFEEDGRGALAGLIDFVQQLDIQPLVDFSKKVFEFFQFVGEHWKILLSVAGGIKAISIAIGILSLATQIFGTALGATPVGIILTAVGLLVTAVALVALNWDKVKEGAKSAIEFMKNDILAFVENIIALKDAIVGFFTGIFDRGDEAQQQERHQSFMQSRQLPPGTFGTPSTPTPLIAPGGGQFGGLLNVNFNNKPEDVEVTGAQTATGVNVNITPALAQ